MENYLMQKLTNFKKGKIWRVNFLYWEVSKFSSAFFFQLEHIFISIVNRKNIKFQVQNVLSHIDTKSNLMVEEKLYDNLSKKKHYE